MPIEKRKFPRVNITCKLSVVFADRLLVFNTHTENMSAAGIRVILQEKLNISTMVDIDLFLLGKEIPIRCKGRVVWANEITPVGIRHRLFDTGIEFIEINDYNREEIIKFVNDLLAQERRDKVS